jgi:hypothetical protein
MPGRMDYRLCFSPEAKRVRDGCNDPALGEALRALEKDAWAPGCSPRGTTYVLPAGANWEIRYEVQPPADACQICVLAIVARLHWLRRVLGGLTTRTP